MELFSNRSGNKDFTAKALGKPADFTKEPTFMENFGEGLRMEIEEGYSISKAVNWTLSDERRKRQKGILKGYQDGSIPKEIMEQHRQEHFFDLNALGIWSNTNLGTDYMTDDEMNDKIREDLKFKREYGKDLQVRSTGLNKWGQPVGSGVAAAVDPITLPTYFVGVGAAGRGAVWSQRAIRAAGITAATEVPFETVKQMRVYDWKQNIMSDYSFNDAIRNVVSVTLGAGALGGTMTAVSDGVSRLLRQSKLLGGKEGKMFRSFLENELIENKRIPDGDYKTQKATLEEEVKTQNEKRATTYEDDPELEPPSYEKPVPEANRNDKVMLKDDEDNLVASTLGKEEDRANTIAEQAEAARGCL